MRRAGTSDDRAAVAHVWTHRPVPGADLRPSDRERIWATRMAAVRAAHGSAAEFEWAVRSGPASPLEFRPRNSAATRWWSRVAMNAFAPGEWVRSSVETSVDRIRFEFYGVPAIRWPSALTDPAPSLGLLDRIVRQFRLAPPGVELAWRVVPSRLGRAVPEPDPDLRAERPVGIRAPRREVGPRSPTRVPVDLGPAWESRVLLGRDPDLGPGLDLHAIARALESATRTSEGNGLRFSRIRRWTVALGSVFALAERDLLATFPSDPVSGVSEPREPGTGLALGRRPDGSVVSIPIENDQGRHVAIVGETGMGKSSLVVAVSRRLVRASGLVLLDPLGETARSVRDHLPNEARERMIWIDTSVGLGLNALEPVARDALGSTGRLERQVNDLVHALRRVRGGRYAEGGFWGPRLEEMLTRAIRAAATLPDGTLADAHALLAAEGRGYRTVPPESIDAVRELADRIRARPEDADGARRLLHEVVRSPTLMRMLCARKPDLRVREIVDPSRVVLIAGDAHAVGEATARYLLSIYLALVWNELLARPGAPKTWVVLDEAQWFGHESLAEMLRLARRRNVHVMLATQSIASLPEAVSEAVWTNVADFVVFRGSPREAHELARAIPGLPLESLVALPRGEAICLLGKGERVERIRTARRPGAAASPAPMGSSAPPPGLSEVSDAPASVSESGDTEGRILRELETRARGQGPDARLKVSLAELRAQFDPTGAGVRAVGAKLSRAGALLATDRDERGGVWWIDPSRLLRSDEGPGRPLASRGQTGAPEGGSDPQPEAP